MTDELAKPLPPLPQLRVVSIDLCSQENVDKAIQYIYDNYPTMFHKMEYRERMNHDPNNELMNELEDYLRDTVAKHVDLPKLSAITVVKFEMRKRTRMMFGIPMESPPDLKKGE